MGRDFSKFTKPWRHFVATGLFALSKCLVGKWVSLEGNMSSDSEMSEFSDMSGNPEDEDVEEGNDEDYDVIYSEITPYQDGPLAQVDAGDENTGEEIEVDKELDEDGLTPTVLEARYEKRFPVNSWSV